MPSNRQLSLSEAFSIASSWGKRVYGRKQVYGFRLAFGCLNPGNLTILVCVHSLSTVHSLSLIKELATEKASLRESRQLLDT